MMSYFAWLQSAVFCNRKPQSHEDPVAMMHVRVQGATIIVLLCSYIYDRLLCAFKECHATSPKISVKHTVCPLHPSQQASVVELLLFSNFCTLHNLFVQYHANNSCTSYTMCVLTLSYPLPSSPPSLSPPLPPFPPPPPPPPPPHTHTHIHTHTHTLEISLALGADCL